MTNRALSFDSVADQYHASRPGYPADLFDTIEQLTGGSLRHARVVDVGAGTGISTRLLRDRGARVIAVEPGPGMAAQLHRALPDVPLVRGFGDALPLADESVDLLTYAQSWHWTDHARSVPEALRVLRPDGALVLWWNRFDHQVPWIAEQDTRLCRHVGDGAHGAPADGPVLPDTLVFTERRVRWSRQVSLDTHLSNLESHSIFRVIGEQATAVFLAAERAELLRSFPDGLVDEAYVIDLAVALRDQAW